MNDFTIYPGGPPGPTGASGLQGPTGPTGYTTIVSFGNGNTEYQLNVLETGSLLLIPLLVTQTNTLRLPWNATLGTQFTIAHTHVSSGMGQYLEITRLIGSQSIMGTFTQGVDQPTYKIGATLTIDPSKVTEGMIYTFTCIESNTWTVGSVSASIADTFTMT